MIEFDIMYGEGISKMGEILDLGVTAGIVEKSGSWFSYNSERVGQGRENAKTFLRENPAIADEIELKIRENAGLVSGKMLEGKPDDDEDDDNIEPITPAAEDDAKEA
jgi:recombination protein RecA